MSEKTAVILAAGRGSRLKEMTLEQPKPMVEVNHKSIIANLIEHLIDCRIDHIVLLVGYMADKLQDHLAWYNEKVKLTFINNKIYDKTNNIYTLWLAKKYLKNGFYLFEADIFCEREIIYQLLNDQRDNIMVVDKYNHLMNGTVIVHANEYDRVKKMYLKKNQGEHFDYSKAYKTVNFYKISKNLASHYFLSRLDYYIDNKDVDAYYELIVENAIEAGFDFYSLKTGSLKWWEIDTSDDLEIARKSFEIEES